MTAQTQIIFDPVRSERLTSEAIERAERNNNFKNKDWSNECMRYLEIWLRSRKETFMNEDFRQHVKDLLPPPTTEKVYGAIIRKAKFLGWIEFVKFAPVKTVTSHKANASVWRSVIVKR